MNFYFLLEDEKSFLKVLPKWLTYMDFGYHRVADIQEVSQNNYILQSGQGVTQLITKALFAMIDTLLENPGKIDYLVVILDTEELQAEERKRQVKNQITKTYINKVFDFKIEILVCNHCFETWLLGCLGLYPNEEINVACDFYEYYHHYNIEESDPEMMLSPQNCRDTIAKYHFHYLHELLRYKRIRYSKSNPSNVATQDFFDGIVQRALTTDHIKSFRAFYYFIQEQKNPLLK